MLLRIELATRKKEVIYINVFQIVFLYKKTEKLTSLFDSTGMEYVVDEPFESLSTRIEEKKSSLYV